MLAPTSFALAHTGSSAGHAASHASTPMLWAALLLAGIAIIGAGALRFRARLARAGGDSRARRTGTALVALTLLLTLLAAGPHLVHHVFGSNQPEACDFFQFAYHGVAVVVSTFTLVVQSVSRETPARWAEHRRTPALSAASSRAPPR